MRTLWLLGGLLLAAPPDPPVWDPAAHPAQVEFQLTEAGHDQVLEAWAGLDALQTACLHSRHNLTEIHFEPGHVEVPEEARPLVEAAAAAWAGAGPTLYVHAHADPGEVLTAAEAQSLSALRAAAVLEALARAGVPRARLVAAPHGWALSALRDPTPEQRARNRRVSLSTRAEPELGDRLTVGPALLASDRVALEALARSPASGPAPHGLHAPRCCLRAGPSGEPRCTAPAADSDDPQVRACTALRALVEAGCTGWRLQGPAGASTSSKQRSESELKTNSRTASPRASSASTAASSGWPTSQPNEPSSRSPGRP